jgi:hypothetical protein
MKNLRNALTAAAVGAVGLALMAASHAAAAPDATRVKIGAAYHRENGCSESYQSFKIAIPNPVRLDPSYKGELAGVEVVYVEGNGTRGRVTGRL